MAPTWPIPATRRSIRSTRTTSASWRSPGASRRPVVGADANFQATPLMVDGVVYTTAGSHRAVVALDAVNGEMLWLHREDEGRACRTGAAQAVRTRPGLLVRRPLGADRLCHAGLPPGGARRQDRRADSILRRERHRRPEARRRPGDGSRHRRGRPAVGAGGRRRHGHRRRVASRRRRAQEPATTRRATSAPSTSRPASACGSSTPSRSAARPATRPGRAARRNTPATPACGRR